MDQPGNFTAQPDDKNSTSYEPGINALTSYSLAPGQFLKEEHRPSESANATDARTVSFSPQFKSFVLLLFLGCFTAIGYLFYSAISSRPKQIVRQSPPATIKQGQATRLSWSVQDTDSVTITSPSTDTYRLTVTGPDGCATKEISVKDKEDIRKSAPVITSFSASPYTIRPGAPSLLTWSTQRGERVLLKDTATGEVTALPLTGSLQVSPRSTRSYILTVEKQGRVLQQAVLLTVRS